MAVPIAFLAFLASWLIPQVELKQWPEPNAEAGVPEAAMAVPGATVSGEVLDQPGPNGTASSARTSVSPESLAPQDAATDT